MSQIEALLPPALEPTAIRIWYFCQPIVRIICFGRNRYCRVCASRIQVFWSHRPQSRRMKDVVCSICLSHRRHRLAWIYLNSRTNLTDGAPKKLLHLAPDTVFIKRFKKIPGVHYVSADLVSPHAMVKMGWADASFDVVYCSHVLEHVHEDRKAMNEMFRVLKPGGWALVQVPVSKGKTMEDPSITDPGERERLFWLGINSRPNIIFRSSLQFRQ